MGRRKLSSLRNLDYSDRELLHLADDLGDEEGWVSTGDLVQAIGVTHPGNGNVSDRDRASYASRCVGIRFSWMVRYGWVERHPKKIKHWRVTDIGQDLMNGRLTKGVETSLAKLKSGDRVLVMRYLTKSYRDDIQPAATMLRREWQRGSAL